MDGFPLVIFNILEFYWVITEELMQVRVSNKLTECHLVSGKS